MRNRKLISICIPVLNERDNIEFLIRELDKLAKRLPRYRFEWVFSDNASTDGTWDELKRLKKMFSNLRAIRFSRNIGYQESMIENYRFAKGDALITYDADMQDPMDKMVDFLEYWEQGYELVYGIRVRRAENFLISFSRKLGYLVLSLLSDGRLRRDVGDFRLIDVSIKEALLSRNYYSPYLRGIVSNLGFREIGVSYERYPRTVGESKFSPWRVFSLGLLGVLNFSTFLLKAFLPFSILCFVIGLVGIFWVFFLYLTQSDLPRGFSSTQMMIFASISLNASFFAIAGNYLLRINHALIPHKNAYIAEDI